jgi:hypothetical protein
MRGWDCQRANAGIAASIGFISVPAIIGGGWQPAVGSCADTLAASGALRLATVSQQTRVG